MFLPKERFTPEGFVSLNFAMVYIFALQLQRTAAMDDNNGSWSFKVQETYTVYLAEFCPQFVSVTASQDGTTRELLLWPPLRNIVYDEYGNLRLFWWSGAQPANETVLSVRRGLSSGRLPSSIVDTDGKIVAVPANFWNSDANHVSDVMPARRHKGSAVPETASSASWLAPRRALGFTPGARGRATASRATGDGLCRTRCLAVRHSSLADGAA